MDDKAKDAVPTVTVEVASALIRDFRRARTRVAMAAVRSPSGPFPSEAVKELAAIALGIAQVVDIEAGTEVGNGD
jgi:hypothetical protein